MKLAGSLTTCVILCFVAVVFLDFSRKLEEPTNTSFANPLYEDLNSPGKAKVRSNSCSYTFRKIRGC